MRAERVIEDESLKAVNRSIAAESIVLLRNNANVLPLSANVKSIAVIGPNATNKTVSGGGSAYLLSSYVVDPLDGITAAAEARGCNVEYAPGCFGKHRGCSFAESRRPHVSPHAGWVDDNCRWHFWLDSDVL